MAARSLSATPPHRYSPPRGHGCRGRCCRAPSPAGPRTGPRWRCWPGRDRDMPSWPIAALRSSAASISNCAVAGDSPSCTMKWYSGVNAGPRQHVLDGDRVVALGQELAAAGARWRCAAQSWRDRSRWQSAPTPGMTNGASEAGARRDTSSTGAVGIDGRLVAARPCDRRPPARCPSAAVCTSLSSAQWGVAQTVFELGRGHHPGQIRGVADAVR